MPPIPEMVSHAHALCSVAGVIACWASISGRRAWVKDRSGAYLWCNDAFASDAGGSVSDVVGRSAAEVWMGSCADILAIDAAVMDGRADAVAVAHQLLSRDGEQIAVEITRIPVVDRDGTVIGVLGYYDAPETDSAFETAEWQLTLSLLTPEQAGRWADGMRALEEEFTP